MKYKALPLILSLLIHGFLFGQSSLGFKYQAVARDASGYPITNEDISLQIKLYSIIGGNEIDYIENHFVTTNDFGLVNIEVGSGQIVEGDFQNINWGAENHYIEISIDPTGGTNFVYMGSSEILSVPMANYAERAGNVVDTSITNEIQKLSLDHLHNLELNPDGNQISLATYYNLDEIDSLGQKITADSLYFENEHQNLLMAIQNEENRAINVENELFDLIEQNSLNIISDSIYFQNLIDNFSNGNNDDSIYFQTLIDNNTLKIISDSAFLKSLIDANNLAIQQEITRAILAEAMNATNISANTSMINQLQVDLLNDSLYLKSLIDQNTTAIAAEITRAISAEIQNSNNIANNLIEIQNNSLKILNDSVFFKNLTDQIDFYLQEEITRATYRDETISDSVIYLYAKQVNDSTYFQNLIDGLSGGGLDPSLENGKIFVGNSSNIATGVYLTGDAQITNSGFLLINPNAITTNKIANGNVSNSKLANPYFSLADDQGNTGQINLGSTLNFEAVGASNVNYNSSLNEITISSTDNQILSVNGNNLNISSGNTVDLSAIVGQEGPEGPQGPSGNDGVGVLSTTDNGNGTFTISYTDGSSFTTSDLTGPQGPQGPIGPQGVIGPAGMNGVGVVSTIDNGDGSFTISYSDGSSFTSSDLTGPQGTQGAQGPQGIQGPQGPAGNDGINGVGIQSTVDNGDGSFTITYTDGSFFTSSDLTGPQGIQGPQGPIGPQGVMGLQGNDGVGVESTINNGNGTFTINYTDGSSFTSTDLTGPQGPQGIQGVQGPVGPQGQIGPQGLQGPAGNDGISINWYGTVYPAPSSPGINDGYHDPVQRKSFIWNGTSWVTISEDGIQGPQGPTGPQGPPGTSLKDCPSTGSWSQINEEFCIEVNENTAETWWNAAKYCGDQNAHLCSWQEWFYVCQKSGSGTINMTNDWEWSGDGQTGSPSTATVLGNGSCNGSSSDNMSNTNTFRCCFSR